MPRPRPEEPMSNVSVKMPTRLRDALEASGAPSLSAAIVAACEAAIAGNAPVPAKPPQRTDGQRDAFVAPQREHRVRPQASPQAGGKRSYAPAPKGGKA